MWSDGGLKCNQNLLTLREIQNKKGMKIEMNCFAPCHGHNVCDRHFGVQKVALRKGMDGTPIENGDQIETVLRCHAGLRQVLMDLEQLNPIE